MLATCGFVGFGQLGDVTLTETREVIGRVTWTRTGGERKRVSVQAEVLWSLAPPPEQRGQLGPRVTITAKGAW